jgi:hypothetical protein
MLPCKLAEDGEDEAVHHLVPLKRRPVMLEEVKGVCGLLQRRLAGRACANRR